MMWVGLFISFLIACGVHSDARARGKDHGAAFLWFFGTWMLLIVVLPIWLMTRPAHPVKAASQPLTALCIHCGKYYENTPDFCPNCGQSLRLPSSPAPQAQFSASLEQKEVQGQATKGGFDRLEVAKCLVIGVPIFLVLLVLFTSGTKGESKAAVQLPSVTVNAVASHAPNQAPPPVSRTRKHRTRRHQQQIRRERPPIDFNGLELQSGWRGVRSEFGTYEITGTVVNNTGRDLGYAQIEFTAYDKSGAQVDTAMGNTANLVAGERWRFRAVGMRGEEVATFRVANVSGF